MTVFMNNLIDEKIKEYKDEIEKGEITQIDLLMKIVKDLEQLKTGIVNG